MLRKNFAQKTYEVFVSEDNRWLIDSHHDVRSAAMARAEELIEEKRFSGVRVVAESQRTGEEEILLEEEISVGEKPLQIVPIDDAPVCQQIGDFYNFAARQAAGRLLRELLDKQGQTALEFGFDYGTLRLLERDDKLFPAAMQRIGGIQARLTGESPGARNDALYKAFDQIKENARVAGEDRQRVNVLQNKGLAGLVASAPGTEPARRIHILGGLALAMQQRGDWSDKLALLIDLAEKAPDELLVEFIDEAAAEVFDSNMAITDVFGGFGDSVSAFRGLIHLSQGRCRIVNNRSCIAQFNELMATRPMKRTASILLGRVAGSLGGIRPMTREGPDAERDAFKGLVRELIDDAGLLGGSRMAAAIAGRARMVFADPDDLMIEDALGQVMTLLPNRAVRLGFLLDIIGSPLMDKHEAAILAVLSRLVQQLTSLSSLLPQGMTQEQVDNVMEALREKMAAEALPAKWRELFSKTFERLSKQGDDPAAQKGNGMIYTMEDAPVNTTPEIKRREASNGEVLFEEGDVADVAYLILDGEIEIYRKVGNQEEFLATLGRGNIVGEMSLIDNQPRMASARVKGGAKLTVISRADLAHRLGRLGETDKVLRRIIDVFVDRLRGQARLHE